MTNLIYHLVIILQDNRTYGMSFFFPLKQMNIREIKQASMCENDTLNSWIQMVSTIY